MALLALFGAAVRAHPHNEVQQQALLSIGVDVVTLQIRIVPSPEEGPRIFAHIDSNEDGVVSNDEAATFGAQVVSGATLRIDGSEIPLRDLRVSLPVAGSIVAGGGMIAIDANASFTFADVGSHEVVFEIDYEEFSGEWFVQPFYYTNLLHVMSADSVRRSAAGNRVEIVLTAKVV